MHSRGPASRLVTVALSVSMAVGAAPWLPVSTVWAAPGDDPTAPTAAAKAAILPLVVEELPGATAPP